MLDRGDPPRVAFAAILLRAASGALSSAGVLAAGFSGCASADVDVFFFVARGGGGGGAAESEAEADADADAIGAGAASLLSSSFSIDKTISPHIDVAIIFCTSQWYVPSCRRATLLSLNSRCVAPGIARPLRCHWKLSGPMSAPPDEDNIFDISATNDTFAPTFELT